MRKPKYTIRKELVETFVEEWEEYRIYAGKPRDGFHIAAFNTESEAAKWVKAH
jgi:hypothetical protein